MELYSRLVLQFSPRRVRGGHRATEVFVFGNAPHRGSRRQLQLARSRCRARSREPGRSPITRAARGIGECFHAFDRGHARRVGPAGRGRAGDQRWPRHRRPPRRSRRAEVAALRARSHRLVWLNPPPRRCRLSPRSRMGWRRRCRSSTTSCRSRRPSPRSTRSHATSRGSRSAAARFIDDGCSSSSTIVADTRAPRRGDGSRSKAFAATDGDDRRRGGSRAFQHAQPRVHSCSTSACPAWIGVHDVRADFARSPRRRSSRDPVRDGRAAMSITFGPRVASRRR